MTTARKHNSRCDFLFADGRRCRLQPADPTLTLCLRHLQVRDNQERAARAADEIVGAEGALQTPEGIHKALANTFCNLARGLISPRSAAVLGYLGQLMLVNCPTFERMLQSHLPMLQFAMKMRQQLDLTEGRSDLHERRIFNLQGDLMDRILAYSEKLKDLPLESRKELAEAIAAALKNKGKPADAKT